MKTRLFIPGCFLTVVILKLIPSYKSNGYLIVIDNQGVLPNIITFSIFCLLILTILILTSILSFKKPLPGSFIINRLDLNIQNELSGITFWTAVVLTSMLLSNDILYIFNGTASYFFLILLSVLIYNLILKLLIRQNRPNYVSINKDFIYLKGLFKPRVREIINLKLISYDTKHNAVIFSFKEGLDNFKLNLTDFEYKDINNLISTIKKAKGEEIIIDENFNKYFTHNI
jgi:hypothetical protein